KGWRLRLRKAHTAAANTRKTNDISRPPTIANTDTHSPTLPASNISLRGPTHFVGRDAALARICASRRGTAKVLLRGRGLRDSGSAPMLAEWNADLFEFAPVGRRQVVGSFDGGAITSDAGALLLGMTDRAIGLVDRFAACFCDRRSQERIEHRVSTLVGQR